MKSLPLLPVLIPTIYTFLIVFIPLVSPETNAQNANHLSLETEKSITIVRTKTPPTIDGILGDEAWSQATVISDFLQSKPLEGAEPTERTEIYLLYDDNMLYIAGRFWDSEPERIAAGTLRHRWNRLGDDDRIAVVLSPYNDQRSGYKFETNANGVKHEAIYQNVSQNLPAWDTIWDAASSINEEGWVTEIAIPFKSISFDSNNNAWGMNFSRAIRRKNEEITWISRNRTYNPSITGQVNGFTDLNQG
ncbi:MAG: carbohydrate binding family 9 domain-containing protein, partial [Pseudomonadota bacterium]|nr:carbohydrate binding family 9 domain-containing protein [Pseudomonadota bacterium]